MSTDVFLVGLGCLTVIAGLILALSGRKRADKDMGNFDRRKDRAIRRDSSVR